MAAQPSTRANRINTPTGVFSLIFPASVAIMVPFLSPVIVAGLVDSLGWTEKQAGLLISLEIGALAWSALAGLFWLNRVSWRLASLIGCILLALSNLASCFAASDATTLIAVRAISGVGAGTLIALCYGALAQTRKPHRNYGLFSVNQMALAIVCLSFLPIAINGATEGEESLAITILTLTGKSQGFGMTAFYISMLALAIVATGISLFWVPDRPQVTEKTTFNSRPVNWLFAIIMLTAIGALMISQQGVWTYAARMGEAAGIDRSSIGVVLSFGALAGLIGAFTATTIGVRISRSAVIICIAILHFSALTIFLLHVTVQTFLLGILLHKFTWNFMIPYQLGMMAEVEKTGRAAVLSTFITSTGISAGAAIAAFVVNDFGYKGVIFESMFFVVLYVTIMLFVHSRLKSVAKSPIST